MVRSSSLFSQVLGLVPRHEFEQDVRAVQPIGMRRGLVVGHNSWR